MANEITLDNDSRDKVMRALIIGLSAYGELDKLNNAWALRTITGEELPDDLRPIEVSACAGEIANFADALRLIGSH